MFDFLCLVAYFAMVLGPAVIASCYQLKSHDEEA